MERKKIEKEGRNGKRLLPVIELQNIVSTEIVVKLIKTTKNCLHITVTWIDHNCCKTNIRVTDGTGSEHSYGLIPRLSGEGNIRDGAL